MSTIDYSQISPGVRDLVRELREVFRLKTTDSGDGSNYAAGMQGARPERHVAGIVPGHFRGGLIGFADFLQKAYPDARVEVSYSPGEAAIWVLLPDGYSDETLAELGVSREPPPTPTPRDRLVAAIRRFTVDVDDGDTPNGPREEMLGELGDILKDARRGWAETVVRARDRYDDFCNAASIDTKELRQAAENYFGGDFRAEEVELGEVEADGVPCGDKFDGDTCSLPSRHTDHRSAAGRTWRMAGTFEMGRSAEELNLEAERDRLRAALESLRTECQEQADSWERTARVPGSFCEGRIEGSVKAYRRIARLIDAVLNPPAKGEETDD